MNANESTLFDNGQYDQQESADQQENQTIIVEEKKRDENTMLQRIAAMAGGMMLGGGGVFAATKLMQAGKHHDQVEDLKEVTVSDDLTFEDAFNQARAQVGPGGIFRWHGGIYNTYTEDEWNSLSDEEREAFSAKAREAAQGQEGNAETYQRNAHHEDHPHDDKPTDPHKPEPQKPEEPEPELKYEIEREGNTTVEGHSMIMAEGRYEGHKAYFYDIDRDGVYDAVQVDVNDDGTLDESDEILSLEEEGLSIEVQNKELIREVQPVNDEFIIGDPHEQYIEGQKVVFAEVQYHGQRGVVVDLDLDGKYDIAMFDVDGDGQISPEEKFDVSGMNIGYNSTEVIHVNNDEDEGVVIVEEHTEEVNGKEVIVGQGTVKGYKAVFVDYNRDGKYDDVVIDVDKDGSFSERIDLRGQGVNVADRSLVDPSETEDPSNTDDLRDPSDPDYVNDATRQHTNPDATQDNDNQGGEDTNENEDSALDTDSGANMEGNTDCDVATDDNAENIF